MRHQEIPLSTRANGYVRTLRQQEELPLLRDHLLRLDPQSRHDRFNGFMEDSFIESYAAKCADDGTVIIAYIENGVVRGAAELHPPDQSPDALPEIAFSVEASVRRQGVGSILFRRLIKEARFKGYQNSPDHDRRTERGDAGARQQVRRAPRLPPGRIHRQYRPDEATPGGICKACVRGTGQCGTCHDPVQSDVLEMAFQNVWLGKDGLIKRARTGSRPFAPGAARSRCACRYRIS